MKTRRLKRLILDRARAKGAADAGRKYVRVIKKMSARHSRELENIARSIEKLADTLEQRIENYGDLITQKENEINAVRRLRMELENDDTERRIIADSILRNSARLKDHNSTLENAGKKLRIVDARK